MKKTLKLTSLALALALAITPASIAFAETAEEDIMLISAEEAAQPDSAMVSGAVTEISLEEGASYILFGDAEDPTAQTRYNVGEETVIIRADGTPAALAEIEKDNLVVIYHATMATFSLPAQSPALAVVLLESEEDLVPLYITVGDVTPQEEGGISFTSADGNYIFHTPAETPVLPYRTRNIVTLQDINEGSKVFIWANAMTMSIPAQANPEKIMLIARGEEEPAIAISVNGEALEATLQTVNDVVMLPLRSVSEKLGYTVIWNGVNRSVVVSDSETALTLVLDQAELGSAARNVQILEQAPTLINELTYVPASFFNTLIGSETAVTLENGVLNIQK